MNQVEVIYIAIDYLDIELINATIVRGCSPNVMRPYTSDNGYRNMAMQVLDIGWSFERLDIVDMLLDSGLDVNHKDDEGHTLLLYILDFLKDDDFTHLEEGGLSSVERVRGTFNKIMSKSPENVSELFGFALKLNYLSWFVPYVDCMTEEDQELFKGYRLALLFEK